MDAWAVFLCGLGCVFEVPKGTHGELASFLGPGGTTKIDIACKLTLPTHAGRTK